MTDEVKRYNVTRAHIAQTATRHNNQPYIIDSDVRVQDVYVWHELFGIAADEIAQQYQLSLAQIYAALAFAYDHLDEIEQYIDQDQKRRFGGSPSTRQDAGQRRISGV